MTKLKLTAAALATVAAVGLASPSLAFGNIRQFKTVDVVKADETKFGNIRQF